MVDHTILVLKLVDLEVPVFIVKWSVSFLSDRNDATKYNFKLSSSVNINRSIVQGSGIGPNMFIMLTYDLKAVDTANYLLKFADDYTLLCPEKSPTSAETEMSNITAWAQHNKMVLNLLKTKELVICCPNVRQDSLPPPLPCIERLTDADLLGVIFMERI